MAFMDFLINNACIEMFQTSNKKVFYIIDEIFKAIANNKQISFKYYTSPFSASRFKNSGKSIGCHLINSCAPMTLLCNWVLREAREDNSI